MRGWMMRIICLNSGSARYFLMRAVASLVATSMASRSTFIVVWLCAVFDECLAEIFPDFDEVSFRKMYICDSRGDEGVDLLALLEQGGLRSQVAVVQAKTSIAAICRGLVLTEYGKYQMMPNAEKYIQNRRALDLDNPIEGSSWSYMLLSNPPFDFNARKVSCCLGILLRFIHQITVFLAKKHTKDQIEGEVDRLSPPRADLSSNFFTKLSI